ncbi:MAG: AMP-binding protein [Erysipelotrichaceae bacterium]|nr:AMP-binding protein [Erysipelotrichaceae bacterium]
MELQRRTLLEYLHDTVRRDPQKTAVIFHGESFSWSEVDRCSDYFAVRLLRSGLKRGEHVGIWCANSYNWIIAFLAAVKLDCLPVAVNTSFKYPEVRGIVEYAKLRMLLFGDGHKDVDFHPIIAGLQKDFPDLLALPIGGSVGDLREEMFTGTEKETKLPASEAKPDDILAMLLTSGTTGKAKGVMLSHYNLTNTARSTIEAMGWTAEDRMFIGVSLFHCFGLTSSLISSIILGCTMCPVTSFRTKQTLECVQENRCTILNGVPTMFLAMLRNPSLKEYDLSSLRCGIIAGSAISPTEYMDVCKAFPSMKFVPSYGQTETSPAVSFSLLSDTDEKNAYTAGKILPHVEARIVSLKDRRPLPCGETGELEIRGYNVMQGYYRMEELTKETISADGWLKTGDLAVLDEENYLYMKGRCKDLIIRGGENISPQEIENVLLEKCPWLAEVCVVSLPAEVIQERIAACVILKEGEKLQEEEIRSRLKKELADYKIPDAFILFDHFPVTASGKVRRPELVKQLTAGEDGRITRKEQDHE